MFQNIEWRALGRRVLVLMVMAVFAGQVYAQREKKFDPVRFETELEQFITTQAALTPQEAAAFFPVYREMRKKQMAFFTEDRRFRHVDTADDKACAEAIRRHDDNDIEIKEIQKTYHNKFMKILPAGKVFRIIHAEEKFHRQMFKRAANHPHQ